MNLVFVLDPNAVILGAVYLNVSIPGAVNRTVCTPGVVHQANKIPKIARTRYNLRKRSKITNKMARITTNLSLYRMAGQVDDSSMGSAH